MITFIKLQTRFFIIFLFFTILFCGCEESGYAQYPNKKVESAVKYDMPDLLMDELIAKSAKNLAKVKSEKSIAKIPYADTLLKQLKEIESGVESFYPRDLFFNLESNIGEWEYAKDEIGRSKFYSKQSEPSQKAIEHFEHLMEVAEFKIQSSVDSLKFFSKQFKDNTPELMRLVFTKMKEEALLIDLTEHEKIKREFLAAYSLKNSDYEDMKSDPQTNTAKYRHKMLIGTEKLSERMSKDEMKVYLDDLNSRFNMYDSVADSKKNAITLSNYYLENEDAILPFVFFLESGQGLYVHNKGAFFKEIVEWNRGKDEKHIEKIVGMIKERIRMKPDGFNSFFVK